MNSAGLPGTGIGGLFYILLALTMPFFEFYQTIHGRGSLERWKLVLRQFAIALLILVGVEGAFFLTFKLFGLKNPTALVIGNAELTMGAFVIAPLVISWSILILVIVGIRIWAFFEQVRNRKDQKLDSNVKDITPVKKK